MRKPSVISMLAKAFLTGESSVEQFAARCSQVMGRPWPWIRPLARNYIHFIVDRPRPRHREVVDFIRQDAGFQHAWLKHSSELSVQHWLLPPQRMQAFGAAQTWNVPPIESAGALADWLWLEHGALDWFADLKGLECKNNRARLRHYHYRVLAKPFGSVRLIEAPKGRLKELQRRILAEILEGVPSHPAAHGFLKAHSIKTFTAPHVGQRVVLRMDLRDFFASISGARIQSCFRTLGYPEPVADLLGGLCTNAAPRDVWNRQWIDLDRLQLEEARALYSRPHLPQGAPTSPALANICAFRIDCRLAGLARSAGAAYTRYADDLAFSGNEEFEQRVERFSTHAAAILREEGFSVHHRKTRIMRQGVRQHLAGIVVNDGMNVMRTDFDRLKATLTNCVRWGPESQNREGHRAFRSHLEGRIAFVAMINANKGQRLSKIFEQIEWN